jgi:hypothetical protein
MKNKKLTKLIYKNLDGTLSNKEMEVLKNEWDNSESLKKKYNQILEFREKVSESGIHSFKPLFEERLLDKLSAGKLPEAVSRGWTNSLVVSFHHLALAAAIILILLITYNLESGNYYSFQNLFGTSQSSIELAFDPVQNLLKEIKQ